MNYRRRLGYAFSGFLLFRNILKEIYVPNKIKAENRENQEKFKVTCSRIFCTFFHLMLEDVVKNNGIFDMPEHNATISVESLPKETVKIMMSHGLLEDDTNFHVHMVRLNINTKRPINMPIYVSRHLKPTLIENYKDNINAYY